MSDAINTSDYYSELQMQAAAQRSASTKDTSMGMQDFLKLLVAQLQNQDMTNPMDNSQFIAQMAQFSSLQAMNSMAELSTTSYAVSMIGKEVTAAVMDSNGMLVKTEGVVSGVALFNGEPVIYIGDKSFALASIMTVGAMPDTTTEEPGGESNDGDNGDDGTIGDQTSGGGDDTTADGTGDDGGDE